MTDYIIRRISNEVWNRAQKFEIEFARSTIASGDDWNVWWKEKFDHYNFLSDRTFPNVLEVGCGPHTNLRFILPQIRFQKVFLEDPLIQIYISHFFTKTKSWKQSVKGWLGRGEKRNFLCGLFIDHKTALDVSSARLEELPYRDAFIDLVVCINVLDHVNDYDRCMFEMNRVLRKGGVLILGQDLSNEEDLRNCPESYTDIGHPIKLDHVILDETLADGYVEWMRKILPRAEGRNPAAHYGTYLGVFEKK